MSKKSEIENYVKEKLIYISGEAERSYGKAMFANLRRGIGHIPGELPELFGVFLMDMPEDFLSKTGEPTKEEWSCYISLTLYALHQQGLAPQNNSMNKMGYCSIGNALRKLADIQQDSNAQQRALQRLKALASANDMMELSYHLRGIIQLLKRDVISLNYPQLAADLYQFQFEDQRPKVCLKWGQDFYRITKKEESKNGGEKNEKK